MIIRIDIGQDKINNVIYKSLNFIIATLPPETLLNMKNQKKELPFSLFNSLSFGDTQRRCPLTNPRLYFHQIQTLPAPCSQNQSLNIHV